MSRVCFNRNNKVLFRPPNDIMMNRVLFERPPIYFGASIYGTIGTLTESEIRNNFEQVNDNVGYPSGRLYVFPTGYTSVYYWWCIPIISGETDIQDPSIGPPYIPNNPKKVIHYAISSGDVDMAWQITGGFIYAQMDPLVTYPEDIKYGAKYINGIRYRMYRSASQYTTDPVEAAQYVYSFE